MYYALSDPRFPCRWLEDNPAVLAPGEYRREASFLRGRPIRVPIPLPVRYTLKPIYYADDHGPTMPAYFHDAFPAFSDDFIAMLQSCGVDNLETYPASIYDPETRREITSYKAVNVVGLVQAADMAKSDAIVHGEPILDVGTCQRV